MARRLYISVFLLSGLMYASAAPAARITPCERELLMFSDEAILSDAGDLLATVEVPPILSDTINPLMGLFEPVSGPIDKGHKNEIRTARDLATFLAHQQGRRFVFAGQFRGSFVPVFDGLVLDTNGLPLYNVSLKFASVQMPEMKLESLLGSVKTRLNHKGQRQKTRSLLDWLKAVNLWRRDPDGRLFISDYQRDLLRGVQLSHIFDLNNPCRFPCGRELRTVVDMRESGYSYEFVNDPKSREAIQKWVDKYGYGAFTLTLLWDSARVIEFN